MAKKFYLAVRKGVFSIFYGLTFFWRRKSFSNESIQKVLIITLQRVGDTILSIPAFKAIKESLPRSRVTVFANSYIKDILERIPSIDSAIFYPQKSSFLQKARQMRKLRQQRFDLALDFSCDYTLEGALLSWLSGAKYRVGYHISGRGFLFHRPVQHEKKPAHALDEILNIPQAIELETKDKSLRIEPSDEARQSVQKFLKKKGIKEGDLLIGIHPGGHYPTQRWMIGGFAQLADRIVKKYKARIILICGPNEEALVDQLKEKMTSSSIVFSNQSMPHLLGLIQSLHLLVCNNSGPLHMATALGTTTVSTMGPTLPERWWPHGEGHSVVKKNLSCMPCNEGYCRLKTHACMTSITINEMLEAVDHQISELKRTKG